ncbi:MAG: SusC/RagA family TonB-linked outer membrane protein, partial [Bacteroidetes bacterium]|nr:SusC/RagA family TonB-linked outer membrane protein [Bacteroidota bacterium]
MTMKNKLLLSRIYTPMLLLVLIIIGTTGYASAQERSVSGVITDSENSPLPGANVTIKGTTTGTVTDLDGQFTITVPSDESVLVISFVGFIPQEVNVGNQTSFIITLEPELTALEEIVVVGYGAVKKENLTGAVATVNLEYTENMPTANTAAMLQGRMSGVTVYNERTQPGEDNPTIIIRGQGTFKTGKNPLIIVDGVESSFNHIPASDIESISVLKDAASAAIYGVRAANGVILITTKRGTNVSKPTITFRYTQSWEDVLVAPDLVDSWEFAEVKNSENANAGTEALFTDAMRDGSDPDHFANTNWFEEIYDISPMSNTYLSIQGSGKNVNYMLSGAYLNQDGIMKGTSARRYNFRSNIDFRASDRIKFGLNLSGNKRHIDETLNDASATNQGLNYIIRRFAFPTVPVKYTSGDWGWIDGVYNTTGALIKNPVYLAQAGEVITDNNHLEGRAFADFEVIKGLRLNISGSAIYNASTGSRFSPTNTLYDANGNMLRDDIHNTLSNTNTTWGRYLQENLLTYNTQFGDHGISALVGQATQFYRHDYFSAYVEDFPNNFITELNAGIKNKDVAGNAKELALSSFFGRIGYSFASKYLIEANLRYDGTSRFARENRWGVFPSFSAGWIISRESFLANIKHLSLLKLRASWGQLGNQDLGSQVNDYYPYVQNINTGNNYLYGGAVAPGIAVTSLANPDLTWEITTITNFGVD